MKTHMHTVSSVNLQRRHIYNSNPQKLRLVSLVSNLLIARILKNSSMFDSSDIPPLGILNKLASTVNFLEIEIDPA